MKSTQKFLTFCILVAVASSKTMAEFNECYDNCFFSGKKWTTCKTDQSNPEQQKCSEEDTIINAIKASATCTEVIENDEAPDQAVLTSSEIPAPTWSQCLQGQLQGCNTELCASYHTCIKTCYNQDSAAAIQAVEGATKTTIATCSSACSIGCSQTCNNSCASSCAAACASTCAQIVNSVAKAAEDKAKAECKEQVTLQIKAAGGSGQILISGGLLLIAILQII